MSRETYEPIRGTGENRSDRLSGRIFPGIPKILFGRADSCDPHGRRLLSDGKAAVSAMYEAYTSFVVGSTARSAIPIMTM